MPSTKNHNICFTLSTRRKVKKLLLFYKIVNKEAPDYLYELVPPLVAANVNYNLRNSHNIHLPFNRLSVYQNSYFPCTIQAWNSLDLTIRNLPTFSPFKLNFSKYFINNIIICDKVNLLQCNK
jgi:hypothetical protein